MADVVVNPLDALKARCTEQRDMQIREVNNGFYKTGDLSGQAQ